MKMKGQLNVKTPAEYIAAVDDQRRSDIAALDALIRKQVTVYRKSGGGAITLRAAPTAGPGLRGARLSLGF